MIQAHLPFEGAQRRRFTVLSLGMGVDSSVLALMSKVGELPTYDFAVFADTGHEPQVVLKWAEYLTGILPFPVYVVKAKTNIVHDAVVPRPSVQDGGRRMLVKAGIPWFTKHPKAGSLDANGKKIPEKGKLMRNCTKDKKIDPIRRLLREKCGIKPGEKEVVVNLHIGFAWDELQRLKKSDVAWAEHRFPLAEKKMTRQDCLKWARGHGFPEPPRSACEFCPYHSNAEWKRLRATEPEAFSRAVRFEKDFQATSASTGQFSAIPFLHNSLTPLDEVDFDAPKKGRLRKVRVPDWLPLEDGIRPAFVLVGKNPDECSF